MYRNLLDFDRAIVAILDRHGYTELAQQARQRLADAAPLLELAAEREQARRRAFELAGVPYVAVVR